MLLITASCTMLNFSASSCATCSKASFNYSSQYPLFRAVVKPFFIVFRAIRVVTAFYLLQVFFGWRFQLPLASIPACFSSSACSRNLFAQSLSRRKYSHIPRTYCSFPIIFQSLPRCAFCFANSLHCQFASVFSPCAFRESL